MQHIIGGIIFIGIGLFALFKHKVYFRGTIFKGNTATLLGALMLTVGIFSILFFGR